MTARAAPIKRALPATVRTAPREFARQLVTFLLIGDWAAASVAIFTGLTLRHWQQHGSPDQLLLNGEIAGWSLGTAVIFVILMLILSSYEVANIYRLNGSLKRLLKSAFLWAFSWWAAVGFFRIEGFTPRIGAVYCMGTLVVFISLWRLLAFSVFSRPRFKNPASSRIAVIGWNDKAAQLRAAMLYDPAQLGKIIGCLPVPHGKFRVIPPADLTVLGDYGELETLIGQNQIDAVVLADLSCSSGEIQNLIKLCQREMVSFQMVLDYFPALSSGLRVQTVSSVPMLGVSQLPLDRLGNRAIKRAMDIVGSLVGLVATALIAPWFCLLVYLESPGPVIFRQLRVSRGGRTFFIYKIRSMNLNAEKASGAVWCKQDDPRRLRIGAFIRRWNIDELPQFWNVLKGEMSLVGPRPERPELIAKFKGQIPNYNARHEVRAGLTGWAQVHGLRGDTDLGKRVEADLYYLENWSVPQDLYCLAATFFHRKNAH